MALRAKKSFVISLFRFQGGLQVAMTFGDHGMPHRRYLRDCFPPLGKGGLGGFWDNPLKIPINPIGVKISSCPRGT